jgi:methyl-accepting chemotaxis protein
MDWFKNLKIRSKLILGFIVITIITIILGTIAIINLKKTDSDYSNLYQDYGVSLGDLTKISTYFQRIRINGLYCVLFANDPNIFNERKGRIEDIKKSIIISLDNYGKSIFTKEDRDLYNDFIAAYNKYLVLQDEYVGLAAAGKKEESQKSLLSATDAVNAADGAIAKLVDFNISFGNKMSLELHSQTSSTRNLMIILIIICAIVSVSLGIFIAGIINKPLQMIVKNVEQISNGDLKVQKSENVSKDELGVLVHAFEKMVDNLRNMLTVILDQSNKLNDNSKELLDISNASAGSSQELSSQAGVAASSSEEVSANVTAVVTSTEEMSSSIREISKNTNISSKLSKESEEKASIANTVVLKLGDSSKEIGHIIKTITSIAEQTNLLALNATIEAARAGESGKGFAVVANEVKELAKESAKATDDITSMIKTIQNDTKNAIVVIEEIINNIKQVSDISNVIASAVEEQTITTNEVNRNLAEANKGVTSIVEVVNGISQSSQEAARQATVLRTASENLSRLSISLEEGIKKNYKF